MPRGGRGGGRRSCRRRITCWARRLLAAGRLGETTSAFSIGCGLPRIGLSIFTFRFYGHHYAHDLADLGWFIGEYRRLMVHWHQVLPNPVLTVALKDWVEDFAGTLRRVLEFIDLPYDSACERSYERDRRVRTVSRSQVRQPVNARGLGRWHPYAQELQPLIAELQAARAVPAE